MAKRVQKAAQLAKQQEKLAMAQAESQALQQAYVSELDTNPKYSLSVDPEGKYGMSEQQKTFIGHYVNFKNVNTAAELTGIDQDTAKQYFIAYSSQQEIRRINLALYHRQFASRLISLDEIGGYLTALLTGDNVPIADQPKNIGEKLAIVRMLIDLNKMKMDSIQNPSLIMANDIDIQIKNLSLATVRQLLVQSENPQPIAEVYPSEGLTMEESAYLSTLPAKDLLDLIETANNENKGGTNNDDK